MTGPTGVSLTLFKIKLCIDPGLGEAASRRPLTTLSYMLVPNLDTSSLHPKRGARYQGKSTTGMSDAQISVKHCFINNTQKYLTKTGKSLGPVLKNRCPFHGVVRSLCGRLAWFHT
jgi:hypothetical protein